MFIEDYINLLNSSLQFKLQRNPYKAYQLDMIDSFASQIGKNVAMTQKQREAALKILKSNKTLLSEITGADVVSDLENPKYKMEVREKQDIRRVSIVDHPQYIKVIQLNISYNPPLVHQIKSSEFFKNRFIWNSHMKSWQVPLTEENILNIKNVTQGLNFEYSNDFLNLAEQCENHIKNMSSIAPMLDLDTAGMPTLLNVSPYVPSLENTDIVKALFEARKKGITTWGDSLSKALEEMNINPVVVKFLKQEPNTCFEIDSTEHAVECLAEIINNLFPCVFILPGGLELEKLSMVSEFLSKINISSQEISVLFRLSSIKNSQFNETVRALGYNNPLNEQTKIAIVSDKIRKPMVQSQIKFHSVINFGAINGAHITMRNFIRMSENYITYSEAAKQRRFHFGIL